MMNIQYLSSVIQVDIFINFSVLFLIFQIEHTSRLLNPTEYLFDILNDCIQSKIINYHLIIKRILWFTIPFQFDINNQSEIFINFIYHQLLPEFLEGIMIILKNSCFSEEFIEEISFLAALQYRASHKIGLPSMYVNIAKIYL